jgi:MscS family membrane protein
MQLTLDALQSIFSLWMMTLSGILAVVAIGFGFVVRHIRIRAERYESIWLDAFASSLLTPFYIVVAALWINQLLLSVPSSIRNLVQDFKHIVEVFLSLAFAVAILLLINQYLSNIQDRIIKIERNQSFPNSTAWLTACKLGRLISVIVFVIVFLNMLSVPIGQLLAPTAVGALALSFASKDVLSNVFGGLMVMCDRPFVVGDYVSIRPGEEGTVRAIGWRTTEIQLQNGRILHVPNGLLATTMVTNYTEKSYWFVQKEFGLRYEDLRVAKDVAEEVEKWVLNHSLANRRRVHFARVFKLSDSAVVIRVRVHLVNTITVKDWYMFNEELIYIVKDIVEKHKADFAFPTRTIHMHQ